MGLASFRVTATPAEIVAGIAVRTLAFGRTAHRTATVRRSRPALEGASLLVTPITVQPSGLGGDSPTSLPVTAIAVTDLLPGRPAATSSRGGYGKVGSCEAVVTAAAATLGAGLFL